MFASSTGTVPMDLDGSWTPVDSVTPMDSPTTENGPFAMDGMETPCSGARRQRSQETPILVTTGIDSVARRFSKSTISECEELVFQTDEDCIRPLNLKRASTMACTPSPLTMHSRKTKRRADIRENQNQIVNYFSKVPAATTTSDIPGPLSQKPINITVNQNRSLKAEFSVRKLSVHQTSKLEVSSPMNIEIPTVTVTQEREQLAHNTLSGSGWQFKKPQDVIRSGTRSFAAGRPSRMRMNSASDDSEDEDNLCDPSPTRPRRRYTRSATVPVMSSATPCQPKDLFHMSKDGRLRPTSSSSMPTRTPSPTAARRCSAAPVDVPGKRGHLMRPTNLGFITGHDMAASPDSLQIITALNCGYSTDVFKPQDRNPFL
ncbi:hypothetical protein HDU85_004415 [Gaertneriomyces sp. JEL0708]|nr:hypothetical protein HDU85_004415 [Gaertneriomyces sp. JEL0708]